MIFQFELDFDIFPKPRGKLGRYGNIYHNDKEYRDFKKSVEEVLFKIVPKGHKFDLPLGVIMFQEFAPKTGRGAEKDLDNMIGCILDCLVQKSYIPEDNRRVCGFKLAEAVLSDRFHNYFLLFDKNKDLTEALKLLDIRRVKADNQIIARGIRNGKA